MKISMDHITVSACPECGCSEVKRFDKSNQHSNGEWNERLTFTCGLVLHYSPNFGRVDPEDCCTKSPESLAWKARRQNLAEVMVDALIANAGISASANLAMLKRSLASDLDLYRDDIERVKP